MAATGAETWNTRYGDPENFAYGKQPNVYIEKCAKKYLADGPRIVAELASGEGRNVVMLAQMGHHVHAVDFSSAGLQKTLALAAELGCDPSLITTHLADVVAWAPPSGPGSLDAVIMSFCHMDEDKKEAMFQNIRQNLKPGGLLLLETFRPDQIHKGYRANGSGGPANPDMMYSLEQLRRLLPGGEELEGCETEYELQEGPYHAGVGAVVRYVWRKA